MLSRTGRYCVKRLISQRTARFYSVIPDTPSASLANEATSPLMQTVCPGPKSTEMLEDLKQIQECAATQFFLDYNKSYGNYLFDADNNRMLDVFGQIASLPLGYNHPAIMKMLAEPATQIILANRPALGVLPPLDWAETLEETLMRIAPKGMTDVTTMACGSTANENAFKAAFIKFMTDKREGRAVSQEELNSSMLNSAPGCPDLSILSFTGAFHGRTFGCLATTRSKPIHKLDIPHFQWPMADFPALRYPLDNAENAAYNIQEEKRCLQKVRDLLVASKAFQQPIAGMIIEPIQAEGGDNHASHDFFRKLRQIAKDHGVCFIVDEVQTGGGPTGKFWAFEHWDLLDPPDIVTFAKKCQIAGFFSTPEMRPKDAYRIFNTWMGDPAKLLMLKSVIEEIESNKLLENATITGDFMYKGLKELEIKYSHLLGRVRGVGTFLALSVYNTATRDAIITQLKQRGVLVGGCGAYSIRFRPTLVFQPTHAAQFLDIFDEVCSEIKIVGEVEEWDQDHNKPRNVVDSNTGEEGRFHQTTVGGEHTVLP